MTLATMHNDCFLVRITRVPRRALTGCASLLFAMLLIVLLTCNGARAQVQGPARPQAPPQTLTVRRPAFRAVSYEVFASLAPESQTLAARATVEFEAQQPSRTIECELHPNLRVTSVRNEAGDALDFDRDDVNPLIVRVALTDAVAAGQRTKLTFEYSGPLANEEGSPVNGVRLAWIGAEGAYLLLPARWFPLTDYPSNRYTGVFHIEVPQNFVVGGTGAPEPPSAATAGTLSASAAPPPPPPSPAQSATPPTLTRNPARTGARAPTPLPAPAPSNAAPPNAPVLGNSIPGNTATSGRIVYTFHVDRPEAAGTFVAGPIKLRPVQAEGIDVSVYTSSGTDTTAQAYGEAVARIEGQFSNQFGPLPQPGLAVAQIPDGSVPSFAAPGLLLISQRQWGTTVNTRLLSNLVASQWWGQQVMAASPSDAWLTDGLARYCEALYIEQSAGVEGMNKALDDFAVGALMYENSAPIDEAGRLDPFSPSYTSVVVNKGAMVFHMLREQLGDAAFFSLLGDFYKQYSGKVATLDNFEKLAEDRASKLKAGPGGAAGDSGASGTFALGNTGGGGTDTSGGTVNLAPFFAQWVNSTGVPEFSLDYTIYRLKDGFRIDGKVKQNLDFFHMPVELEILTEGNPEYKTIPVSGTESTFDIEVFGRPKPNGITLDPHNYILKSSARLQVRAVIARGEAFAEQGRYYDAIQQYSQALDMQKNSSLAEFRTGEAFFYQKNYSAAANTFRDALDGDLDPSAKWVEVWSHIYLGKIYDIAGDRTRAVNEYSKAQQTNDDTGGAQAEAQKYLTQAFTADSAPTPISTSTGTGPGSSAAPKPDSGNDRPVLKRKDQ